MIQKAARYPLVGVKMLREEKTEVDPLASDEVEALLAKCPAWWRPYFTVSFWSGARPGELAALKWGNVDWRTNKFRILARRYRGNESTPKTKSSTRDVDMLQPVIDALKAQRAQQAAMRLKRGEGKPEVGKDYVFTGPTGGFLSLNFLREKIWYPPSTRPSYAAAPSTKRVTLSRAMPWPLARIRNGWRTCSATSLRRSCLTYTRSLFRGGRGSMEAHYWLG
jgi:integrase